MTNLRGLLERSTGPYGLILVVGAGATLVQSNVKDLPDPAGPFLQVVGILGLAIGGAGIGLDEGRSEAGQLRHAAELTRTRMVYPFSRMVVGIRALAEIRNDLQSRYDELKTLVVSDKIEWKHVDKSLALATRDLNHQLRDVDQAVEEWRDLLPEEVARLEAEAAPRAAEIDRT